MGRPPKYTPEFRRDAVEYCVSSGKKLAFAPEGEVVPLAA